MSRGEDLLKWLKTELEPVKLDYEGLFADIAKFVNPRRELIKDSQRFDKKGQRRGRDVYDGTPNSALGIWRDGMQGFMVSESLRWFKSEMNDHTLNAIDEVRTFQQEYDEAMYAAFRRSNFYSILPEWFGDAGSIGTAPLFIEEDIGNGKTVHTPIHLREIFIAENRYGEVDVVFRKFFLTARQAKQRFDEDKLHPDIAKNAKDHPEKPFEFVHAVFPNNEPIYGKVTSSNKKFKSVYLQIQAKPETEEGHIVKDSGFDVFPYAVWRFRKNSDEIYGYSPAADGIIEIFSLQQLGKTMLKAAHLSVSPSLNVPEHMRGHVRMEPEGYNYFEKGGDLISQVQSRIDFPIGIDREERLQKLLEDKYRVEFFRAFIGSTREKTATEIIRVHSEQTLLLAPQVNRLTTEGLGKVFDIVANIEDRAGRLPPPPQILIDITEANKENGRSSSIDIRFIGPLPQAQRRLFKLQPIKEGIAELGQVSVFFPQIFDRVNESKLSEELLDNSDFPQTIMNSDEEVKRIREEIAAAQAQQQAIEQLQGAAEAYPKLTKKPEEGSPAEAVMGAL